MSRSRLKNGALDIRVNGRLISRGEVGLIVASVGVRQGLVTGPEFSAIVAMVLVSTLVTPPLLRALFARSQTRAAERPSKREQVEVHMESPKEES